MYIKANKNDSDALLSIDIQGCTLLNFIIGIEGCYQTNRIKHQNNQLPECDLRVNRSLETAFPSHTHRGSEHP